MHEAMTEKTVLVVDDSPISLRHAVGILKERYRVACAKSGQMALGYLERQIPDLILLDVNMPEMDGLAVFRRLRERDDTKGIPVLFLTGLEDSEFGEKLAGISSELIIQKPPQPKYLLERVAASL